jgi:RHS repeat-associated protein
LKITKIKDSDPIDSDANYNRINEVETQTIAGATTTLKDRTSSFDANNRLTQITENADNDTIDYIYDNNGNTLSKTDNTQAAPEHTQFAYDSRNQLSQVIRGPPAAETNQGYYDYNYRGQRIRHLDSERGNIDYLYDGQAVLEERTLGSNTLVAHYRYSDRLISLNTATDEQYYHYSALRTTANLTNTAGDVQVSYRTDAWGKITQQEGDSPNRQVFTGQEHDENTGLIYFGARYYDPDTARFINQDSYLGESSTPPSLHRYLYAYGNPTVYVDPDGHAAYFFGGTGNHPEEGVNWKGEKEENYKTIIEKLHDAYDGDKEYAYGIGTGYEADGTKYDVNDVDVEDRITRELATGQSMDDRVEWMMKNLEKRLKSDKVVDVFGFSRGGASAVDFLNRIQDQIDDKNPLYKDIEIRFAGIVDSVPSKRNSLISYSNKNLNGRKVNNRGRVTSSKPDFRFDLPKGMKFTNQPIHTVAIDERRAQFAVTDLKGAKQVGFAGVHSDVGGWYQNSRFDWLVRDYMVGEAKNAGLKFNQSKLDSFSRFGEADYNKWISSGKDKYHRNRTKPTDNSGNFWINDNEDRALPENLLLHPSVDYLPESKLNNVDDKKYLK